MNKKYFIQLIFATGVWLSLGMVTSTSAADGYSVKPSAEEQRNYKNYVPRAETMAKLSEFGLPRYLPLSPPGRQYLDAVGDVVGAVNGEAQTSREYGVHNLKDTVTADFAATVVDLAFVYEGFKLPAPDGIKRAISYGLTPLTLAQCADLFISSKPLQNLLKKEKFPMMQCPGTQGDGAIAQIYFSSKAGVWRAGGLGRRYVNREWPMAIYAGPNKCANC